MDTSEAIKTRRSVKRFDKNHLMTRDEIGALLELALLSPTSYNIQNWRFVTVTDQALKDRLCEMSYNQMQVSEASLVIILCADLNAWNRNPGRYWMGIPPARRDAVVASIKRSYASRPGLQRDEAMRSCGIASQTIMLAARSMGYDTCPMEGFDYDAVGRLINLPDDHIITMMVVVGKKRMDPPPRGSQLPLSEVVFEDSFRA